ncbi:MAG: hypothetical protein ACLVJX_10205 [Merdibacter sp.]
MSCSANIDVFICFVLCAATLVTRVLSAVAGCIVLAFGISVEVAPDLIMVPVSIVAAISKVSGRRFGSVKVVFDDAHPHRSIAVVAFSAISSAWASGRCLPSASASSSIHQPPCTAASAYPGTGRGRKVSFVKIRRAQIKDMERIDELLMQVAMVHHRGRRICSSMEQENTMSS